MPKKDRKLTKREAEQLLTAFDEIERYTRAARSILAKAVPSTRKPGGAQCGAHWAADHGGAQCEREYAEKVGGAQCVAEYDAAGGTTA